jgi:hypothetical protein
MRFGFRQARHHRGGGRQADFCVFDAGSPSSSHNGLIVTGRILFQGSRDRKPSTKDRSMPVAGRGALAERWHDQ